MNSTIHGYPEDEALWSCKGAAQTLTLVQEDSGEEWRLLQKLQENKL